MKLKKSTLFIYSFIFALSLSLVSLSPALAKLEASKPDSTVEAAEEGTEIMETKPATDELMTDLYIAGDVVAEGDGDFSAVSAENVSVSDQATFTSIAVTNSADFSTADNVKIRSVVQPYHKIISYSTTDAISLGRKSGHVIVTASVGSGQYAKVSLPNCSTDSCEIGSTLKITCVPTDSATFLKDNYGSALPGGCNMRAYSNYGFTDKLINKYGSLVSETRVYMNRTSEFRAVNSDDMGRSGNGIVWLQIN